MDEMGPNQSNELERAIDFRKTIVEGDAAVGCFSFVLSGGTCAVFSSVAIYEALNGRKFNAIVAGVGAAGFFVGSLACGVYWNTAENELDRLNLKQRQLKE